MIWQPISTAPRDGTFVLLGYYDSDEEDVALFTIRQGWFFAADRCWYDVDNEVVQHPQFWMEQPDLPPIPSRHSNPVQERT